MSVRKVGIREARQRLRLLLEQAQSGDEIVVMRRGVEVGRLVPPKSKTGLIPDLNEFRASIRMRGTPLSREVCDARRGDRY
jgi:prevent-host-death family protein